MSKKSIMITGVSTGIGLGTLSYFVKNGFHVYGSVRNSKDASRLKKIYKDNFTPLIFDVTTVSYTHLTLPTILLV